MDSALRDRFLKLWEKYFPGAELPLVFSWVAREGRGERVPPPEGHRCLLAQLGRVRRGESLLFDGDSLGCGGAKRFLGFSDGLRPGFEFFLSCGIPGVMEGERYKKSPELVREMLSHMQPLEAPGNFILFERIDRAGEETEPEAAVFLAPPDVLSGLFTLANYDVAELNGVIAPMGAGCATIVYHPHRELARARPRAVLGMFDVSARPWVEPGLLSFAVPWPLLERMVNDADESFLITPSWEKVRRRLAPKTT